MNTLKRLGIALWRTLLDQGDLIAMQVLLPPVAGAISKHVRLAVTGTHIPHEGPSRLASYRQAVTRTMDGAVLDGEAPGTWAKYAIPKGLPSEEGDRRMAIENQAHSVEERSFVIKEGYGKGTKTLAYAGTATYKIDGESHFGRVAVHFHQADNAGPHYDLVCEGVPVGTERWELALHNGPFKGRYVFVDASGALSSGEYNEGRLVTRMRDRGVRLEKPNYEAFGTIEENLAFMQGQKFYAGKKAEIEVLLAKAQVLRHELAAVVVGRFVVYEQAQLKKLAASGA